MERVLKQKLKRLAHFQKCRNERLYAAVYHGDIELFKLLPLLFHYNHPSLPGFTPNINIGIEAYAPAPQEQHLLTQLLKIKPLDIDEIHRNKAKKEDQDAGLKGVYAMGSTATMGQSLTSDIDIWLCINPNLSSQQRERLAIKCERLTNWYKQSQLEITFFIMDEDRFQHQLTDKFDSDHCGSTQHLLLLDEFYRSAIFIAGLPLLWYIVPTEQEYRYDAYINELVQSKQIDPSQWINFGSLANVPISEYLGATAWQLSKGIDAPYKSVIKIILLEVYASQYPNVELLSSSIKRLALEEPIRSAIEYYADSSSTELLAAEPFIDRSIKKEETEQKSAVNYHNTKIKEKEKEKEQNINFTQHPTSQIEQPCNDPELDAYFLMYQSVAHYLEKIDDYKRLELVRRCFYLKTHEKLSFPESINHGGQLLNQTKTSWRRQLLQQMVHSWRWDKEKIASLDSRRNWKIKEVKNFHDELFNALMESYRNLNRFIKKHEGSTSMNARDMNLLFRRLSVSFDIEQGKIVLLNKNISPDMEEEHITLVQVKKDCACIKGWYLYDAPLDSEAMIGKRVIMQSTYVSHIIAWCYFNGVITSRTQIYCHMSKKQDGLYSNVVSLHKIDTFLKNLHRTFSSDRSPQKKRMNESHAFSRPSEIRKLALFINLEHDPSLITEHFEITDHSYLNAIGSIDFVYKTSWGELKTENFSGEEAVINALRFLLSTMHQNASSPELFDVYCYSAQFAALIKKYLKELFESCITLRLSKTSFQFKVIQLAQYTYGLFFSPSGVKIQELENPIAFYQSISSNKLMNATSLDLENSDSFSLISALDRYSSEGLLQFFFEDCEFGFNIYISDESNKIESFYQCTSRKTVLIKKINAYYRDNHFSTPKTLAPARFNLPQYYDIQSSSNKKKIEVIPFQRD